MAAHKKTKNNHDGRQRDWKRWLGNDDFANWMDIGPRRYIIFGGIILLLAVMFVKTAFFG